MHHVINKRNKAWTKSLTLVSYEHLCNSIFMRTTTLGFIVNFVCRRSIWAKSHDKNTLTVQVQGIFYICIHMEIPINTLRPRQNGRHFPDDIFKCIFTNENIWILIEISLKFVPKGPINSIPALVQIMAWRRLGDKPLSETMMVSLLTPKCVTRPQWVKAS